MDRIRLFALALLVPLAGACASSEPEFVDGLPAPDVIVADFADVVGTYTLISYGGNPLPVQTESDEIDGCVEHVVSGELMLGVNGEYTYTFVEHELCEGDVRQEPAEFEHETETIRGEYRIDGGRIHFDETENDQMEGEGIVEMADLDVGWFQAGQLHVQPEDIEGIRLVFVK